LKKVKVIFPDGSIAEINESELSGALAAGAKRHTEKSTSMVFKDGSIADIPDNEMEGAMSAGAVKKKAQSDGGVGGGIGGVAGSSKAQSVEPIVENNDEINKEAALTIGTFKRRGQIPNAVKDAGGSAIVKTPEILFSTSDKEELKKIREKYNVITSDKEELRKIRENSTPSFFTSYTGLDPNKNLEGISIEDNTIAKPFITEITDAKSVEDNLTKLIGLKKNELRSNEFKADAKTINKTKSELSALENDLRAAKTLRNKLAAELTIEGENEIDANISTDESGNLLNKTTNRLMAISQNPSSITSGLIGISQETSERIDKLPSQFVTGLNYLKNSEPVIFERITDALQKGLPISESQIATITQQGVELEQARFKRKLDKEQITPEDYSAKALELNTVRKNNLLDNNETLRAFLSDGAANILDELGKKKNAAADMINPVSSYAFGHTWNYDDAEIKYAAEEYAKKNGLDPQDGRIQKAIKYLQDNEGSMIMENSIAKAGGVRELFKGLAEPIRGISNSVEDLAKSSNDVYVESQSQGNTNVSEKRLKLEDTGIRGVVNDVVKGTGQFVTQAGLAYLTSGAVGAAGKALLASETAVGSNIGSALMNTKDGISTFITSYAQSYDSNLKTALNYTSDNQLAKQVASVNSALEGATELFLSPLDIAKGIGAKFASKGVTEDLLKVLSDKNLMKNPDKLKDFLTKTIKGISGTSYVVGAEIGEETVTQIADYVTNATLNPNSQSFQNRDLQNELTVTAYQTGLSMVIPALLNGIGAANANTFSKGSLLVAAQNRQKLIEGLDEDLALNNIDQDEYNEKAQIINTAAVVNAELPLKADGAKLNTDEKADYIFSRTSEAVMKNKIEKSKDEAEKRILEGKIKEQQDFRTELLKSKNETNTSLTEPIEGIDQATGIPIGDNVPPPVDVENNRKLDLEEIDKKISEINPNDATAEVQKENLEKQRAQINDYYDNYVGNKTKLEKTDNTPNIIPALKEKITNLGQAEDADVLTYAIDKVAEAPTKLKADLGDELFNQVLAQTPTEKLQEGLDFLINNNPDSKDVDVLDKIISDREAAATKQAQPKTQEAEEIKPPSNRKERLAAFKKNYVEPVQTETPQTEAEVKKQWSELSIQEKLALAKENLPEVDNLPNTEAIKVADDNAKMLLAKLNKQVPKVNATENVPPPVEVIGEGKVEQPSLSNVVVDKPALKDVKSTAKALEDVSKTNTELITNLEKAANIVYHGNMGESFRDGKWDKYGQLSELKNMGDGIHLGTFEQAKSFLNNDGADGYIYKVKLDAKNLKEGIDQEVLISKKIKELVGEGMSHKDATEKALKDNSISYKGQIGDAEGLKYKNTVEGKDKDYSYVVLNPDFTKIVSVVKFEKGKESVIYDNSIKDISEAYHKAKKDGNNPELVKAVEQSLPTQEAGSGVGGDVERKPILFKDNNGNNIVFEKGDYRISVDDENNARKAVLWHREEVNGKEYWAKRGVLNTNIKESRYSEEGDIDFAKYLNISEVEIEKDHRGQGLSTQLYKALIDYSGNDVKAILSYTPSRVNKTQVPKIWKRLGGRTSKFSEDYQIIDINRNPKAVEQSLPTQAEAKKEGVGSGVGGDVEFTAKGGNKVVDEKGEPLIVYHSNIDGDNTFTEFKPQSFGEFGENKMFYFAEDKNWVRAYAKRFANNKNPKIREFELNIKNPLDLSGLKHTSKEWIKWLEDNNLLTDKVKRSLENTPDPRWNRREIPSWQLFRYDTGEFRQKIIDAGYDGLKITDSNYGSKGSNISYVALEPNQIRLKGKELPVTKLKDQPLPTQEVKVEAKDVSVGGDVKSELNEGDKVGVRLNLNIRKATGENVLSVHDKSFGGKVIGHTKEVTLRNVKFSVNKNAAEKIASGESSKFPMASIDGEYIKSNINKEGVEIFFDPKKNNQFVDKDGFSVNSADEVSVIGNKAYARGLRYNDNENFGYHGGNLKEKSDYLTQGYRGDQPFTGHYFFSDRSNAEGRGNRSQLSNNDVSVVDFSKYNLLKPTTNEYWSIKAGLKRFEDSFLRNGIDAAFESLNDYGGLEYGSPKLYNEMLAKKDKIKKAAQEWKDNELENIRSKKNIERLETVILKAIGYEGVDVRGLKEKNGEASPDSSSEGSVIFDIKPESVKEKPVEQSPTQEVKVEAITKLEAERDAEIDKVSKPDLKLELVKTEDLVNSKDPEGNREKHNEIKERYKNIRKLIECL